MVRREQFTSQSAAAHAMAWLEMGDSVRRHKDGRIYVELPKAGGGERRIWSQPVPGGRMPWTEESANRALELIRSRIAQGGTVDEAGDRSPTYVRELERYLAPNGHFSWWRGAASTR